MLIDFYYLILTNTFWMLFQDPYISFMLANMKVLRDINVQTVYELGFNGEVSSMESYLNQAYGIYYDANERDLLISQGGLIWIETYDDIYNTTYIFNRAENQPATYIYNTAENETQTYIINKVEIDGPQDFIVWVPVDLQYNYNTLYAQVNRLRAYGKTFIIQTY